MNLKQLRMLMYDSLKYPALPSYLYQNRKHFMEASCRQWAIEELYDYCSSAVPPTLKGATITEYYMAADHFRSRMEFYATIDKKGAWRFNIAANVATELLQIFDAIT